MRARRTSRSRATVRGACFRRTTGRRTAAVLALAAACWTAVFAVAASQPIPVGIDGEAAVLSSPALFRIRPAVLRVRIAAHHPGASPSAIEPVGAVAALRALTRIAAGRDPRRPAPPIRERLDAGQVRG